MTYKKRVVYLSILTILLISTIIFTILKVSKNVTTIKLILIFVLYFISVLSLLFYNEKISKKVSELIDWLSFVSTSIIILLVITSFFIYTSKVSGDSMLPTVKNDSIVFIKTFNYKPQIDDVVTYETNNEYIVKRVVGLKDDVISFTQIEGLHIVLTVNNEIYYNLSGDKYYLNTNELNNADLLYLQILASPNNKLVLKDDELILLGDNANVSYDSRQYGILSTKRVLGKVLGVKNGKK